MIELIKLMLFSNSLLLPIDSGMILSGQTLILDDALSAINQGAHFQIDITGMFGPDSPDIIDVTSEVSNYFDAGDVCIVFSNTLHDYSDNFCYKNGISLSGSGNIYLMLELVNPIDLKKKYNEISFEVKKNYSYGDVYWFNSSK